MVVGGEAGIGKTALVAAVCDELGPRRVLWGACDPLDHAAPARPAARRRARRRRRAARGARRPAVARGRADRRPRRAGGAASILVVEDLHWADDATLDLVALLGRRLARARGCLVLTVPDRGARASGPRCGGCSARCPRERLRRIEPAPLSADAVALLAAPGRARRRRPARGLGRQPVLRHRGARRAAGRRPGERARRGRPARRGARRRGARGRRAGRRRPGRDRAVAAGRHGRRDAGRDRRVHRAPALLQRAAATRSRSATTSPAARSRSGISPVRRRELDRARAAALEARGGADPARLAHHARRAGDADAIRRLAPAAARAASAARRPPAGARALGGGARGRGRAAPPRRSRASSVEAYLCGGLERALEARARAAARSTRPADDALRVGDDLRWLSRLLWWSGRGRGGGRGRRPGDRGARGVPGQPRAGDGAERPVAARDARPSATHEAIALGDARRRRWRGASATTRPSPTRSRTSARRVRRPRRRTSAGRALLEEAYALAVAGGHDDHAARALVNLATGTLDAPPRRPPRRRATSSARCAFAARARARRLRPVHARRPRAPARCCAASGRGAEADARASLDARRAAAA